MTPDDTTPSSERCAADKKKSCLKLQLTLKTSHFKDLVYVSPELRKKQGRISWVKKHVGVRKRFETKAIPSRSLFESDFSGFQPTFLLALPTIFVDLLLFFSRNWTKRVAIQYPHSVNELKPVETKRICDSHKRCLSLSNIAKPIGYLSM